MDIQSYVGIATTLVKLLNSYEKSGLFISTLDKYVFIEDHYGLGIKVGDSVKERSVTWHTLQNKTTTTLTVGEIDSLFNRGYSATGVPIFEDSGVLIGALVWVLPNDKETMRQTGQELSALSEQLFATSEDFANNAVSLSEMNQSIQLRMDELSKRLNEIETISRSIAEIASQSHMLGLNAAIEAARAGDHGRGFSVVADEIRKLATNSKDLTKEISDYVKDMSNSSSAVLSLIAEGQKASEQQAAGAEELSAMVGHISQLAQTLHATEDLSSIGNKTIQPSKQPTTFIEWENRFNVNVGLVDDQHKRLVRLINELYDAMQNRRTKETYGRIVKDLLDYTKTHFRYEEDWMQRNGYKDFASHKSQHDSFVRKVEEFKNSLEQGKTSVSFEIVKFLKDWLLSHIMIVDKKYVS